MDAVFRQIVRRREGGLPGSKREREEKRASWNIGRLGGMGRNESNETVWDRTDQDEERECDGEWKKVRVDEEFVRIPIAVRFARGEEDERMFISIPSGEGGVCFSRNPVYSAKKAGEKFGGNS